MFYTYLYNNLYEFSLFLRVNTSYYLVSFLFSLKDIFEDIFIGQFHRQ